MNKFKILVNQVIAFLFYHLFYKDKLSFALVDVSSKTNKQKKDVDFPWLMHRKNDYDDDEDFLPKRKKKKSVDDDDDYLDSLRPGRRRGLNKEPSKLGKRKDEDLNKKKLVDVFLESKKKQISSYTYNREEKQREFDIYLKNSLKVGTA